MPEGTTTTFGSWACTANGSDDYTSHRIAPEEPEAPGNNQDQLVDCAGILDEMATTWASPALDLESAGDDPAATRLRGTVEPDVVPNFEDFFNLLASLAN